MESFDPYNVQNPLEKIVAYHNWSGHHFSKVPLKPPNKRGGGIAFTFPFPQENNGPNISPHLSPPPYDIIKQPIQKKKNKNTAPFWPVLMTMMGVPSKHACQR